MLNNINALLLLKLQKFIKVAGSYLHKLAYFMANKPNQYQAISQSNISLNKSYCVYKNTTYAKKILIQKLPGIFIHNNQKDLL